MRTEEDTKKGDFNQSSLLLLVWKWKLSWRAGHQLRRAEWANRGGVAERYLEAVDSLLSWALPTLLEHEGSSYRKVQEASNGIPWNQWPELTQRDEVKICVQNCETPPPPPQFTPWISAAKFPKQETMGLFFKNKNKTKNPKNWTAPEKRLQNLTSRNIPIKKKSWLKVQLPHSDAHHQPLTLLSSSVRPSKLLFSASVFRSAASWGKCPSSLQDRDQSKQIEKRSRDNVWNRRAEGTLSKGDKTNF